MNTHTVIVAQQDAAAAPRSRSKRLLLMGVVPLLVVGLGLAWG